MSKWVTLLTSHRLIAVALCGTGVALVVHIISGISLRLALAVTVSIVTVIFWSVWLRSNGNARKHLLTRVKVGIVAGCLALIIYDASKYVLSLLDPSPYNPFEAIRIFGILLVGETEAPPLAVYSAGILFHLVNGISFGTAYSFLVREPGPITGITWGLFLELFQLTLYPGWLDIRFYNEFVMISALAHMAYGVVLGLYCQRILKTVRNL